MVELDKTVCYLSTEPLASAVNILFIYSVNTVVCGGVQILLRSIQPHFTGTETVEISNQLVTYV